ncbi:hypothetical protein FISHEDRAFT_49452 [Fistulina hepatica ATCC 64428]|uniref:F-box domain-containing protein n=1 Tax=Fistulina hepatica ATCC 64428 TaxID=1128425 RepID=A0A0D7A2Y8_9AGAR|nr:hypothetical protein FISHEDRAFT_49452 [Fistulina hepatica ATCC 64428]
MQSSCRDPSRAIERVPSAGLCYIPPPPRSPFASAGLTSLFCSQGLNEDVVDHILDCGATWWPRDLARLARVSLAWLGPVRRRLYRCPTAYSNRALKKLADTLFQRDIRAAYNLDRSSIADLRSLVLGLDLRPVQEKEMLHGRRCNSSVCMASLRRILSLPGLRTLTLGGELSIKAERFLYSLSDASALVELSIDGKDAPIAMHAACVGPSLEWDVHLSRKFPQLRVLRLAHLELDIEYPWTSFRSQLSDFVLDNVTILTGFLTTLVREIKSLESISVVTYDAFRYDAEIKEMLESRNLEQLHYEVLGDAVPSPFSVFAPGILARPSLRRLCLSGVHVDAEALELICRCCPNLEELAIRGDCVTVTVDEWQRVIESGALPALRFLEVPWGTRGPPFVRWDKIGGEGVLKATSRRRILLR